MFNTFQVVYIVFAQTLNPLNMMLLSFNDKYNILFIGHKVYVKSSTPWVSIAIPKADSWKSWITLLAHVSQFVYLSIFRHILNPIYNGHLVVR